MRPIALVEDQAADRHMMEEAFEAQDQRKVMSFKSGEEVLDYLKGCRTASEGEDGLPCVIILDLSMPVLSGVETLQQIRGSAGRIAQIPVVALTSSTSPDDLAAAYAAHVNAFIPKPQRPADFIHTVQKIGNLYGNLNRLPAAQ